MSFLFGGTPFDGYARDGRRSLNMGGGGGGGPQQSTTQTSNIPDWMRPQVETALGAATQQIFNVDQTGNITGFRPYVPYSTKPTDYVAGFAPMQNQAFQSAANLQTPTQFAAGSNLASTAGQGALGTTGAAMGYGGMGAGYGQQGANIGQGALGYGAAGAALGQQAAGAGAGYQQMATDPSSVQAYMNPYVQASLAPQLQLMNQQLAMTQNQNQAQAVKQGAYGGSRQAVQQGLDQQNADLAKAQLIGQGYNQAFKEAQQAQQFGANLGLQGLQAGMQGQQVGLAGVQGALAGTAQGIQGAQAGLAGVQGAQQGYSLANQAAANLGQLGSQQLAAQQNIIGLQNQLGGQQQQYQQGLINQAINNYAMAQQYPQQQLSFYNSLLRGYATPTVTTSQYQASPNPVSQLAGLGLTGAAAYGLAKKKGGTIKSGDGLEELGMYRAMKGKQ
jgi:hypothetical protein